MSDLAIQVVRAKRSFFVGNLKNTENCLGQVHIVSEQLKLTAHYLIAASIILPLEERLFKRRCFLQNWSKTWGGAYSKKVIFQWRTLIQGNTIIV